MTKIGTTFTKSGKKAVLCGSGELGKEVALELQRYGVEVVALDKYANAPAMHVAHRSHVLSMLDGEALESVIKEEKPDYIIPEIEAIATDRLVKLEEEGYNVVPTAMATRLTMNREGIRRLAAETLGLPTSPYRFAENREEFDAAVSEIGIPCVVKPVMSSSGHGQSTIKSAEDIDKAWKISQEGGRAGSGKVIVEGFVKFDYEITLLTVRHCAGTTFVKPVGHHQVDGDYRESWQPQQMSPAAIQKAEAIVYAFTIKDHSMGARFKMYDDRQFCNGHRAVTMGMPFGYLISGNYSEEYNLQMIVEGRAQVGGNFLAGIATDEVDPDGEIDKLAQTLEYALVSG